MTLKNEYLSACLEIYKLLQEVIRPEELIASTNRYFF